MKKTIDAVIVDTSILINNQCDFLGVNSSTIPAFYDLLTDKGVILLDQDILHKEIKNHIDESIAVKRFGKLKSSLEKNKELLQFLGISCEQIGEQLSGIDINQKVIDQFEALYKNAHVLPYPSGDKIFDLYFANTPPFKKTGEKKSEFPDAFIIESVKNYLNSEKYKTVLIISSDNDWKAAFEGVDNTIYKESLDEAIKILQEETDIADILFELLQQDIKDDIERSAEYECYEIDDYELIDDDLEVEELFVSEVYDDLVVLKKTNTTITIKCTAKLNIGGKATVFDENNSVWSSEDHEYIYIVHSEVEFKDATAKIECEIEIEYDLNDIENSAAVNKIKIINPYTILISLDKSNSSWMQIYEDDNF